MTHGLRDAMLSAGGALALVVSLIAVDGRVREHVMALADGRRAGELSGAGQQLGDLASIVFTALRDQSLEHAPLVVFGLAGGVLVVFMLRT